MHENQTSMVMRNAAETVMYMMRLILRLCGNAPVAMVNPSTLLALLAAVLRPTATATLGKLPGVFLPLAALVISALPYSTSQIILSAQISHHNSSPILHILRMMADGELFHERKDIEIVGKQVFLFLFGILRKTTQHTGTVFQYLQVITDLQFRYQMGLLEVRA
jgi:hypothetical protein